MSKNDYFQVKGEPAETVQAGTVVRFRAVVDHVDDPTQLDARFRFVWHVIGPFSNDEDVVETGSRFDFNTKGKTPGAYTVFADKVAVQTEEPEEEAASADKDRMPAAIPPGSPEFTSNGGDRSSSWTTVVQAAGPVNREGIVPVSLQRTQVADTPDQVLWTLIRNRTNAISFRRYRTFIDAVMCRAIDVRRNPTGNGQVLRFTGTQAYDVLKQATEAFLMQECGVVDENGNCVRPVGFLDPDLMEAELADQDFADRFLQEEPRRYGRPGTAVTLEDLQNLRELYYERLVNETPAVLPYLKIIREKLSDLPLKDPIEVNGNCYGILQSKLTGPVAMELIWSYWHEEGGLAQTLNVILARFQNRRLSEGRPDPLARFDLDPLRPLANLFWGWAEDEHRRLTVRRRAFEYDHEYGLALLGKALPPHQTVDTRSTFLESFHTLLHGSYQFFKEDDDTTVIADGFPLLNALRETHLILAEGAHNQFGDLPSTARAEMLIMQWLLSRPETREFLGGRVMVPYEEDWMDRVDTMKQLQGWTDVSVTHFRDMGVFGEQLLLAIRYGNWSVVNDPQQAANWARYWRPEIQRFTHAYRAATGVDLTQQVDATLPAQLLRQRNGTRRVPAR